MSGAGVADWAVIGVPILAAALCAGAVALLLPWLKSSALAHPVDRSSHREPTPQGGGLGVVFSTLTVVWLAVAVAGPLPADALALLWALTGAAGLLTLVGLVDDIHGLSPGPRLFAQLLAVGLVVLLVPSDTRLISALPLWVERACLVVLGVWFVNLVNFMDGIDWMTVAEVVPITAAIAIFGIGGIVPPVVTLVALALLGAMLGFAPFNRPVARLFLGDAGSLPVGLVLGWLLLLLAINGQIAAALLLPLYYLADASITLLLRIRRGETPWEAHRTHFYQRAVAGGLTVPAVVARVFATNVALAALATVSVMTRTALASVLCVVGGAVLVGVLLAHFAKAQR
ncbi:MAG: glycosyl transferase [Xanthobacteraceae bacterium]|nr:glycosyl transferase [Xanthobacteraceae bacterium]